ncbi:MAG: hypothetical protein K2G21_00440 [Muribaculaceae bacterium]|nr:hypothetical protein [Muribaculaceae bacterium]
MKRTLSLSVIALTILASCGGEKQKQPSAEETLQLTQAELAQAVADQDSLLTLMNDISAGMNQIKELENILATPAGINSETPDKRQQIRDDIAAIQKELQSRRDRLDALESKLRKSQNQNSTLQKSIETLRAQIDDQDKTIAGLRTSLANANTHIETLTRNVDSLNSTVAIVTQAREEVENQNNDLNNELATCFYALGNKNELKEHNLIETGFLRKTKVMPSDFEASYFTRADKRTLTLLPLHSRKAKVLTNQPADAYTIETDAQGMKSLRITDANRFWEISNFLIIQID